MTKIITSFDEIAAQYDAVFCDLWGCLHNGVQAFPAALAAMDRFIDNGGINVLVSNSPRPSPHVIEQLERVGIAPHQYQEIASSGDAARAALVSGSFGADVYHLGPERDVMFFPDRVNRVPLDKAQSVVCTGLFDDETETPDDYKALLLDMKNQGLSMLCANPDIMVDRGEKRIYCAGALAAAYTEIGGESHYFGKPHPPIYDLARNRLTDITGRVIEDKKILCIGDGINTDIKGAIAEDLDSLFITGGLAAAETGTQDQPDPDMLAEFLSTAQMSPTYAIGFLR